MFSKILSNRAPQVAPASEDSSALSSSSTTSSRTRATASASQSTGEPRNAISNILHRFSKWSTPAVRDSCWAIEDFRLGVGMVIFQPATGKVVLVYDEKDKYWFLPRGRKDIGETLEQAALREAHEESGYNVSFMPVWTYHHQPASPGNEDAQYQCNMEPIYLTTHRWSPRRNSRGHLVTNGGEYLVHWYMGEIPSNPVYEEGTGMPDEQNYRPYILDVETAFGLLRRHNISQASVLQYAHKVFMDTLHFHKRVTDGKTDTTDTVLPGAPSQ